MRWFNIPTNEREISDLLVAFDPHTLVRKPVNKQDLLAHFRAAGNARAVKIVEALPACAEILDPAAVDTLLIEVHCEIQRLSEEFQHGPRVSELLKPMLAALGAGGFPAPIRIVDIGCGTGFVIRWLARHAGFGPDVELIGADYHAALVGEAQRLAAAENLDCSFVVANAFHLTQPATIYLSTGVLHHFRGDELYHLFAEHTRPTTAAFVHFDFRPSLLAPIGAWLFHRVRMRHPLAHHDGVLSAIRAHPARTLLHATRTAAPDFRSAIYGTQLWQLPIPRAFQALVGIRPQYHDHFVGRLGSRAARLGFIQ